MSRPQQVSDINFSHLTHDGDASLLTSLIVIDDKPDAILSQVKTLLDIGLDQRSIKIIWLNTEHPDKDKRSLAIYDTPVCCVRNIENVVAEIRESIKQGQTLHLCLDMDMPALDLEGRTFKTSGASVLELILKDENLRGAMQSGALGITITSSNDVDQIFADGDRISLEGGGFIDIVTDASKRQIKFISNDGSEIVVCKAQEAKLGKQSAQIAKMFAKASNNPEAEEKLSAKYPYMVSLVSFFKILGATAENISSVRTTVSSGLDSSRSSINPDSTISLTSDSAVSPQLLLRNASSQNLSPRGAAKHGLED
jgi:hypothetical protein